MNIPVSISFKTSLLFLTLAAAGTSTFAATASKPTPDAAAHPAYANQALPVALRPVLYQALAKDVSAARDINKDGCTVLQEQSLKACFDAEGEHFDGLGAAPLTLHLVAFGRGDELVSVPMVQPEISGSKASYVHGALTEWWRMLPVGFEQGFTLAKRPVGRGELTLALAVNNHAEQLNGALAWGKLRYGGLVVTDANGKAVPATLKSEGDRILIAVDDTHAAYPLTVDPLVWLEQKLIASDGGALYQFGSSVAVSGTIALIGEPGYGIIGHTYGPGAAYIFTEANGMWSERQKLVAKVGQNGDGFGASVALEGTTALIGATQFAAGSSNGPGAVYVFTESNGTWTQQAKLGAEGGQIGSAFGNAVALDGTTALVGAPLATINGNSNQGAAYVFTDSGGSWAQAAKLTASDGAGGDEFGAKVAIQGTNAFIGAPVATVNGNVLEGATYVFVGSDDSWTQMQKLTPSGSGPGGEFGISIALSGTTALIGSPGDNFDRGAAYIFTHSGEPWIPTQTLTASNGVTQDYFGWSVALNGTTALVGAYHVTVNGNVGQGAAYAFTDSDDMWTQTQELTASDGAAGDVFGISVALEGTTALIGAPNASINGNEKEGAVYFYGESDLDLALSAPETVGQGQQYVSQTIATNNASAASPAVTATVTVPSAASFISASASQGTCSENSGLVSCDFGQINGNAGTATANVTLKAAGSPGTPIDNTASVAKATPALTASASTAITSGGPCPEGYTEYGGNLNPGEVVQSLTYQAPAGQENAILTGPTGVQLYLVFQDAQGRTIYQIPGNEVHRQGPAGYYTWVVKASDVAGAYTLCVLHP